MMDKEFFMTEYEMPDLDALLEYDQGMAMVLLFIISSPFAFSLSSDGNWWKVLCLMR